MYKHKDVESKWRNLWQQANLYKTPEISKTDLKKYILETFPYPSGYAMHVGHAKGYVASDITARFWRLKGYKVLYPMGWDAFGLPAENYAIKTGIHPRLNTDQTIEVSKEQLHKIGLSYGWERELATHRPDYYKWTQWFFQLLYKRGLAYKKEAVVNWDPVDQTVLANEQVLPDGTGERSGAKVEQRKMNQWFFKITDYSDRLLEGLNRVDWPESTKQMQRNWIGRSEGINITYKIEEVDSEITVYTTRPDTNFGSTFLVVAPDSLWVKDNFDLFKYKDKCQEYIDRTKLKTELDRLSEGKVKTGEFTGLHAINPLNGLSLPIYLSDFVLSSVGTGAVVGVPGHDERDFDFAKAKNLPIIRVVVSSDGDTSEITRKEQVQEASGTMINSGFLDGLPIMEAKEKIKDYIEAQGFGKRVVNFRLRDWLVSRQRYWGSPIPVYYTVQNTPDVDKVLEFGTPVEGSEFRSGAMAVVFDPQTQLYACWEDSERMGLAGGGDEGKDLKQTAIDETSEELGLEDIHEVYELGELFKVHYYHATKKLNRTATAKPFLIVLNSNKVSKQKLEEHESGLKLKWLSSDELIASLIQPSTENSTRMHYVEAMKRGVSKAIVLGFDKTSNPTNYTKYQLVEKLVPESNLPVILPEDVEFKPTGRSPLIDHQGFHQTTVENYGVGAVPEVDTMDTFVCSSWYFFRYCSPQNDLAFSDSEKMKKWMPVNQYIIGPEHANLHLLYARFFTKVLFDAGYIDFDEPFLKVRHQGLLMGEDGRKMSKRWGNVVNPDDVIKEYGADTLRMYEMFMGPFKDGMPWSTSTVKGVRRFLDKVWDLGKYVTKENTINKEVESSLQILTKKLSEDLQDYGFNTAVAKYMKFVNSVVEIGKEGGFLNYDQFKRFLILLYPFAPFITEELYSLYDFSAKKEFLQLETWPEYDPKLVQKDTTVIAVQINGKLRGSFEIPSEKTKEEIIEFIQGQVEITKWLGEKTVAECLKVYIPNKIVSLVV